MPQSFMFLSARICRRELQITALRCMHRCDRLTNHKLPICIASLPERCLCAFTPQPLLAVLLCQHTRGFKPQHTNPCTVVLAFSLLSVNRAACKRKLDITKGTHLFLTASFMKCNSNPPPPTKLTAAFNQKWPLGRMSC